MQLVKTISTRILNALRLTKVLRYGKDDVQESFEASPFGIDGNPVKDMIAVYSPTDVKGESVIIGYFNKNRLAKVGELRLYSTDANGNEKFYTWIKNDGTMEIGGSSDNMVRYSELKKGFDQLRTDLNSLVTLYNAHQHFYINAVGAPTPTTPMVPPLPFGSNSTANITQAKITQVKTL